MLDARCTVAGWGLCVGFAGVGSVWHSCALASFVLLSKSKGSERIAALLAKFTDLDKPATEAPIEFEVSERPETDAPAE